MSWSRSLFVLVFASAIAGYSLSHLVADEHEGEHEHRHERGHGGKKGESIEHWMERLHKGRKSPLQQVEQTLGQETPAWDDVNKNLPDFLKMSEMLKNAKKETVRDTADGYVDAVKSLAAAAKNRDRDKARAAIKDLTTSCGDCHYKGGPGGKLD